MGIAILGSVCVDDAAGSLGRRDRMVLAALTMRPREALSTDALADLLWGDAVPASAAKLLQGCVVRLRKVLGPLAIETSAAGYRLTVTLDEIDAQRFEQAVDRARTWMADDPERATHVLADALALWRGPALADVEHWEPARAEASRLEELRQVAEELHVESVLRSGHAEQAAASATALVGAAPLRERRWEMLSLAQYQSGRQGDALATLRRLRATLATELGVDPRAAVQALETAILRQDPTLASHAPVPVPSPDCPYRSLRAYDVADADWFFGREVDIAACLRRLAGGRVLAVLGPSGCGKSSLIRAGVAAALCRDHERVVVISPGTSPMSALAALTRDDPGTTLVVDQCEEAFSLCQDTEERREFLEVLTEHARIGRLVLSFRADRLADVAAYPSFARAIEQGMYLLGGLSDQGLRDAIEAPARLAGLGVEPGLVDLLVSEVSQRPGALPLMSHVLTETWERREGRTLTVAGYRESGGLRGAVAQTAEELYKSVGGSEQRVLRDLLMRLVMPGTEGEPVRGRLPRRLVVTRPEHDAMIDLLVGSRLVTSDDGVVELAHEALVRAWPRLQVWLDDDVEGQRVLHHLAAAADAWESLDRPDSELYRGIRLAQAVDWRERADPDLTDTEQAFLEAGRAASTAELRHAQERARQQSRVNRRLRIALLAAGVLVVATTAAGVYAERQSARAESEADRARQAAVAADARRVGVRSRLSDDISLSLLLAVAGVRLADSPEAQANLLAALDARPQLVRSAPAAGGYLEALDASPDGRWIAASDDDNRMHLYDARTNGVVRSYDAGPLPEGESGTLFGAFSPDSERFAVGMLNPSTEPVRLLDPSTMEPATPGLSSAGARALLAVDVQFSADGHHLAAAVLTTADWNAASTTPGYVAVWDLRSPADPPVRVPTGKGWQGVALSPDGRILYTSWPLTAYDVPTGRRIWRRQGVNSYALLDVNPSGSRLVLEFHDTQQDALVVDTATGRTVSMLRGHHDGIRNIRFSPDGAFVGSTSHDGEVIIWNVAASRPIHRWQTFEQSWSIGFSPDGALVHAGGDDATLRTWDRSSSGTHLRATGALGDGSVVAHADVAPDGQRVAYRWLDNGTGRISFVDTLTGEATAPARLPVYEGAWSPGVWHPDGRTYADYGCNEPCGEPGVVRLVDSTSGRVVTERRVTDGDIYSLVYVDGSRSLLAGDSDGRTTVVDAETLLPRAAPFEITADCCATDLGGTSALVFADSDDGSSETWRVIEVHTGQVQTSGDLDLRAYSATASPDGSTVAVTGQTGEIVTIALADGTQRKGSTGVGAEVHWLHYSEDGERLVSGAADGSISLWDGTSLELLGTLHPPGTRDGVPVSADFVGDTHDVTIASYDGRTFFWDTDPDRAVDVACRMAGRNLTEEEWAQFLPGQPYREVCPGL